MTEKKLETPTNPYADKPLVIRIDGWLWRVVAMTWAISEVAKHREVRVVTSRPLVFRWNPYIKSIHWLDDRRLFEDVIKGNDYIELEPYTDPEFFNDAKNWLDVAAKQLWLSKPFDPCLFLAEHEKLSNILEGNNPILFQPFWSTMWLNGADKSYRSIRVEDAQYLADRLTEQWYTLYEVIKPNAQPKLRNCQMCDTPDLRLVVSLCQRYPVIWCDSSLHHCSKAFGKKALVIRAWTDAERYWYKSNINMREHPMVNHTPLRLNLNDFNFDVSNQHTNQLSKTFLDKVLSQVPLLYN